MGPRVLIIAAMVVVVAAAVCLALDLDDVLASNAWPSTVRTLRVPDGVDWRVGRLRLLLTERRTEGVHSRLHELLVGLIDDRLTEHGIDRSLNPDQAAAMLGPELTRFVSSSTASPPAPTSRIVMLIEEL